MTILHCFITYPFSAQDPESFDPDRWAPDNPEAEKLKELYYPFSLGKRNCVGQNLAALEIKLILASVLRSFRFELVSQPGMDYFFTLKPTNTHMRVYKAEPLAM
jgi:cytochrome P450